MSARRPRRPDERAAARRETQEEAQDAYILPQLGVLMTKESARGFAVAVPLFALFGALVFLPFGLIPYAELALGARLLISAIVGAVAGSVVGFVVGPAVATRSAAKRRAGAPRGRQSRPGKAEVAEATGGHEARSGRRSAARSKRR